MATKSFGTHTAETRPAFLGGNRWVFQFDNGYGASVVNCGYGREEGLYELAVLDCRGGIVYDTPITDDVMGWLTERDVAETLDKIKRL